MKFIKNGKKVTINNDVKTSSSYKAARRQQKTSSKKVFFDDEGIEAVQITPKEWAELVLGGIIDAKTTVSNSSVKGNIPRLEERSHWTRRGFREHLSLRGKMERQLAFRDSLENHEIVGVVEEIVFD
jgi:hypothetical protein